MAEFCLHHQNIFEKSFSQSKRHYVLVFFHFILSNHYLFDKKFCMTTKLHKFDIIRFHSVNCEDQFDWNCLSAAYFALSKVNLVHPRKIIIFIFVIFLLITIGRACTETNFKLHIYSENSTIYLIKLLFNHLEDFKSVSWFNSENKLHQKESLYLFVIVFTSQYHMSREWQLIFARYKIFSSNKSQKSKLK